MPGRVPDERMFPVYVAVPFEVRAPLQLLFAVIPVPCHRSQLTDQVTFDGAAFPAVASWKSSVPSVKLHVAVPEAPVAVTEYWATNQSGRLNWSEIAPLSSAVTSTSRRHVSPASSFTRMCTDSPGAQLAPERATCSPGA